MRRSSALRAAMATLTAAGILGVAGTSAQARPPYCVQEAWYFADGQTGGDRQDPQWSYYNALFQDYNDCYGPNACDDLTIACMDPPV